MRIIFLILFGLFATCCKAQVLQLNSKLLESLGDTTISLKYFKDADSLLLSKIDSFDLYLMKRKYDYDSNYYYVLNFTLVQRHRCRDEFTICYNSLYDDYDVMLFYLNKKNGRDYTIPFAFFFYKDRLVICTTTRQDLHLSKESTTLLTNLIIEHVDDKEKKLILGYPQYSYDVITKPVKRYFLN